MAEMQMKNHEKTGDSARTCKGKRTWLNGKVKCKKCGYAYTVTKSNTRAGRYFQCSGARYSIKCKGAGHTIYADVFEDYVLQGDERNSSPDFNIFPMNWKRSLHLWNIPVKSELPKLRKK